jgi:hypothetical protein
MKYGYARVSPGGKSESVDAQMGRRPKLTPHQQAEAIKRREAGEPIHSTISRLAA